MTVLQAVILAAWLVAEGILIMVLTFCALDALRKRKARR